MSEEKVTVITVEKIAEVAHEVNKAYCESLGDNTQVPWEQAPAWQKSSVIVGVRFTIKHPEATPKDSHNSWLEVKKIDGWQYGEIKDEFKKTHPCFVAYEELPPEQRFKDKLFQTVVKAMLS